jgi:hypothetical protein
LLTKGRVLETILNAEQGVASRGNGSQPLHWEAGKPPARHYDLAVRSSLDGSGANAGEGSAAPEAKTATVERREASVPAEGRKAPRQAPGVSETRRTGASQAPDDSRRSAHPFVGVSEAKSQKPGRKKRAAGTREFVRNDV